MKRTGLITSTFVTIIVGLFFFWSFSIWRSNSKSELSLEKLNSIEKMEKNGLPIFETDDVDGVKIKFGNTTDKVRIVNFWASWCEPCLEEVPSLVELINAFPDKIELYAISGDNTNDDVRAFLKSFPGMKNKNIHIILDKDQKIMSLYGTDRLPESYIADRQGRLVKKIVGTINWHTNESKAFIQGVLDRN